MFYIIYKIKNIINDKIYIGKHQTLNINDLYMGSGKYLKYAIQKYGIENFKKEILYVFDNEDDMNKMEAELVTEEFCLRKDTYNICVGGKGGFSYINSVYWKDENISFEAKSKRISIQSSEEYKKQMSEKIKNSENHKNSIIKRGQTCFKHSEETKLKMKKSKNVKENNPQYGTFWITNGSENKQIKKYCVIPDGWYRGRTIIKKT